MVETPAHRSRALYKASIRITVTLPYTDGELSNVLGDLEEVLLFGDVNAVADSHVGEPAHRAMTGAVGRLASYVAGIERADPAVQPLAPDGRFELVPLFFVELGRTDLRRIAAAAEFVETMLERLLMVEGAFAGETGRRIGCRLAGFRRLGALLQLPWDDDVDRLHTRLGRAAASIGAPTERMVLTPAEHAAYERVTDRILAAWHADDPLERYVYRGLR